LAELASTTIYGDLQVTGKSDATNSDALKGFEPSGALYLPFEKIKTSFSAPGSIPMGLTWDGTNLWSVENGYDKIYEYYSYLKFYV
jgi:hypothetical protein